MGCTNCSSNGLPKGCKNNGACGVDGCEKLSVFDWLANMEEPSDENFNLLEIRFKNGRKEFFRNIHHIPLHLNDIVAVEGSPGHDIGSVSMLGQLVRLQLRQKGLHPDRDDFKKLYRKANQHDIDIWQKARQREEETMLHTRVLAQELGLQMKISDVEYQGDGQKATFYYTAEERVDFRELIKKLASAFKIRVEMRQIGARQEAGRVGGIGSCGRELCCSTWLTDFRSVNTAAARYQQLALNPQKLAGQCGKLKCCLNYELDMYLEALRKFPKTDQVLKTGKGEARFQKMDIFKEKMWYAYQEVGTEWIPLKVDRVNEVIALNEQGQQPPSLEDFAEVPAEVSASFEVGADQDSLTRFDHKQRHKGGNKRKASRQKTTCKEPQ
ncbi:MAG: regulatory iron-sulfur-containing complex subunit RicT [Owenweeksia sp.]|nr:regulatory iron-sulfur-containing complex subunit RicT [Owenweeksia sp.]